MRGGRALIVYILLGTAVSARAQEYLISTFAGGAPPPTPVLGVDMPIGAVQGVATDTAGNTYFLAFHCVFKLDQNGLVTRIAGTARSGYSGDGGPAINAQLRLDSVMRITSDLGAIGGGPLPPGIATDNTGNVYVADNGNSRIRRISPDGIITTVAGNGTTGFSGDAGPATSAQLSAVFGLAVDAAGNLWIADSVANRIRRVTSDGTITTVAGTGDCGLSGDGGPASVAQLCQPTGIASDTAGNLFVADSANSRIRKVTPDGIIATVAGKGSPEDAWPTGDRGVAASAGLYLPSNVAVDQQGDLFLADTYMGFLSSSQVVRKISPSGIITTVAGLPCYDEVPGEPPLCGADGTTATKTFLGGPLSLAMDMSGNLLIADGYSQRIRRASSDGAIIMVAGNGQSPFSGDGGPANSAQLASPDGVALDGAGNLLIADYANNRIRKVSPDGIITTQAGNGAYGSSGDGGPAAIAQMAPLRLTLDGTGNLFFFDVPNRDIRKISPDGLINTVIHVGGNDYFVAHDRVGDLFIADPSDTFYAIVEVSPSGAVHRVAGGASTGCGTYSGCSGFLGDGGPAISAQLVGPQGVAVDISGNLFIADTSNHRIRKVTPDGIITTIAGISPKGSNPGEARGGFSGDGGPAVDAQLSFPVDVALDSAGNIFIADSGNNRIREVSPDGIIKTVAGNGTQGYDGDGGVATRASISNPFALALDGAGNVYIADSANNAVRILRPAPIQRRMPRY